MSSLFIPRLASSKQWTDLPKEFTDKICQIFNDQFKIEVQHGSFLVEGRIYPQEIVIRLGYLEGGRLKQINFEASLDIPRPKTPEELAETKSLAESMEAGTEKKTGTMDLIYTGIDALGSLMEEYFETDDEDELDVPPQWKEYDFEGDQVYLQYSTLNTRLEQEADRLLGLLDDALVQEQGPSEDALANADIDTELAEEVQKAIRDGRYKLPEESPEEAPL
jgi:hypothetical protein